MEKITIRLRRTALTLFTGVLFVGLFAPSIVAAGDFKPSREDVTGPKKEYSPYVGDDFPKNVYFGDTQEYWKYLHQGGQRSMPGFFGVKIPEGAPISIQDRTYTSPIWYTSKVNKGK